MIAAKIGNVEISAELLKAGVNVNETDVSINMVSRFTCRHLCITHFVQSMCCAVLCCAEQGMDGSSLRSFNRSDETSSFSAQAWE